MGKLNIDALIDNTYKTVDDRAVICLYLINSILKDRDFKPYFYVELYDDKVKDEDIETIKDFLLKNGLLRFVENIEVVKKIILRKEKELIKIIATHPQKIPKLRKIKECPIVKEIYEHDIPFAKRYLIDNEIIPMTYWDFENRKPVSIEIPKLKVVAFDMEVYNRDTEPDPERDPILMASFWDENGGRVITYKKFNHPNIEVVENEKILIKRIIETLRQYDIIYTYNGDNFDFPYLKARAKFYGIDVELGREGEELKIKRGGMEYRSYIPGRVHIDLYPISRRLLKLTKYTLEDVTYNLFGVEKLKIPHTKIVEYWANNDETLIEYSLQDAKYTYRIGNYFFPLEVMFSRIVNQTPFETTRMSSGQMVEYLLMKKAFKENMIVPNKPDEEEYRRRLLTTYEGGYVKEPEKGMFEDIINMDFRSLYPSIIISYNISPDTLDCECCKDISEKILGHWFCKKREGLIPKTLRNLIERRINIKRRMKEMAKAGEINEEYRLLDYEQQSLKILANSILPDEYLVVIEDDKVKVTKIGEYVDNLIEKNKEKVKYEKKSEILEVDNLKTYAFSKIDKKCRIRKVKALIRHPYSGKAYKIKLRSGRSIKVTKGHGLFKYENGKIVAVKGDEIKIKDLIVVPRKIPYINKEVIINIPKGLIDADEEEINDLTITKHKDKEFLVKLKKTIEDIEKNKLNVVFEDCLKYLEDLGLIRYEGIKRINKLEIDIPNKRKLSIYKKYIETILDYGTFRKGKCNIQYIKVKEYIPDIPDKEFEDCEIGAYSGKIKALLRLNENLAKFLGYFVARGRLKEIKLKGETVYEACVYKSLPEYQEEIAEVFKKAFGAGAIARDKVTLDKKIVYLVLKYIFKCGYKGRKHIPEQLFLANEEVIKSFLDGFLKAKKNSHKGTSTFMAKDEEYLNQLMLLFNLVGIPTRFTPVKNKGYKLTLNPNYELVKDLMLDEVKEIEEFDYNGYVYDLSVEEDENFLVNNIYAHNSHYGYLAFPRARFYSKECAEVVTYLGRKYIQQTMDEAEKFGFKVIYADSVTENTEIIVKINGEIKFMKIKDLFKKVDYAVGEKEYCLLDDVYALTLNDDGKLIWKKVPYVMRHRANKDIYRVWITNTWYVDVTEDHSLIGYLNTTKKRNAKKIGDRFIEIKPNNLGKDVKSLITINNSLVDDKPVNNISIRFWELVGLLIGDGSWGGKTNSAKYYLRLSAGLDKDEIIKKVLEPLKEIGVISNYYLENEKGDIRILSKKLVRFMNKFKDENNKKIIPKFMFKLSKRKIEAFLRGLFSADGTVIVRRGNAEIRFTNTNENIIENVRKLLYLVGISNSVFKENNPNKYKGKVSKTFSYHINIKNKIRFAERVGFILDRKNERLINLNNKWKSTIRNYDFDIARVKKIEKIDYNGYVYDIEVEDTHRFFANGILVHNTDGFYAIWKEKISKEELIKKALEFVNYINSKLPGSMELEFEGYFKRGIFVTKKRYALIDENGRVTVKGLEFVRRDWSNIAKITQRKVLEALLVEGNIEKAKKIIQDIIRDLRERKIKKEDLIIYTQLTKDPKEYKTTAPHVEIAKRLMREGKRVKVGDIIGYIIVKGAKSISERAKLPEEVDIEDVDVNYYIDNQILPPVLRIMEAVGVSKNELKKEGAQLTLDKFFK
ncbi:DNA polymerase domain-containing protein [Methanocaldococcus fervens]|uniref:DNA polymerase n=1 Tax=Methanocaldococcus fervens (strain DSM 4213 / JCM 15782 / AG86) TaxID=573064 RepID=C7P594_METFA|nr:DNA polymerase domain-containing protein [Methanocaldococcus fervens]ACV25272.1 DNA-directed DNA polymerase [Methanocaldococcus fervens AG86]